MRFYDPDRHIIEVGENMKTVCKRFLDSGMTAEKTALRMDVPVKFATACIRKDMRTAGTHGRKIPEKHR